MMRISLGILVIYRRGIRVVRAMSVELYMARFKLCRFPCGGRLRDT
jgi:hypothetical protein